MTQPTGTIRPLQFPLDRNEDIESETPNTPTIEFLDLSEWTTTDNDERINVVLNLSLNEYVALATCVDVGRDLAYGDNSIYLWWLWTRSLLSMNLCDDIIDCINNTDSGVSEAILSLVGGNNSDDLLATTASQDTMSLMDDSNPTCDEDILFGQCVQLVDYLDQQHIDLFEIIEVSTNLYEAAAAAFGTQSGKGAAAISAFISWLTYVQESIAEVYAAQITTAYKEALACEWFCLAKDNDCQLTPTILFNSMSSRMEAAFDIRGNIQNTINFLISGTWSGQQIADFMFYANFAIRAQVGNWLGKVAWYDVEWHLVAYSNDPDSDWTTLCDECSETYIITFDTTTDTNWDIAITISDSYSYTSSPVLQSSEEGNPQPSGKYGDIVVVGESGNTGVGIWIEVTLASVKTVNAIDFEYLFRRDGGNDVIARQVILFDDMDNVLENISDTSNDAIRDTWTVWDAGISSPVADVAKIHCVLRRSADGGVSGDPELWIDNIRISVSP